MNLLKKITLNISGAWHEFEILAIIWQLFVVFYDDNYENMKSALDLKYLNQLILKFSIIQKLFS